MQYILPRLPYHEGDPFCMKSLEDAVDAIRSLHVCDTIHICPDQNKFTYVQQPILLKLTPDDPFEIRCRFGIAQVSNNFTFRPGTTYAVGGSFIYKNPFRRADQVRFDMDFTRFEHTTAAEYIFPLKTKLPLSGLIKVYDALYQQPLFPGSDQSLYTIIQRGFLTGINLGYKSLTVGLNYGIEWATLTNVCGVCACALDFQPTLLNTNIPSFIIEPTLLAHYENDRFNPWLGSTTLVSMKGVLPLYTRQASTGFIRFLIEQSGFVRLSSAIVLAGRVRMGHVFNQCFRAILPPDRFYLGGAFSVRGYDSDLVPPLSLVEHGNCCVLVPRGGRSMVNLNAELRFEVGRYMILALFQDVGALASDGRADMHWVAATGGGIRFKSPIGIVRFDVGFKWKTAKHESCCAWFLTLGNPF
jgi:outer membrane protein assembly factor BamA